MTEQTSTDAAATTDKRKAPGPRVEPVLTSIAKIDLPKRESKRGSTSAYPFDSLTEVGAAFGVKNKTAAQLSSIVSNANRKNMVQKRGPDGQPLFKMVDMKDANGTVVGQSPTTDPEMVAGKHFYAVDVTADMKKSNAAAFAKDGPFEGAKSLIVRDA